MAYAGSAFGGVSWRPAPPPHAGRLSHPLTAQHIRRAPRGNSTGGGPCCGVGGFLAGLCTPHSLPHATTAAGLGPQWLASAPLFRSPMPLPLQDSGLVAELIAKADEKAGERDTARQALVATEARLKVGPRRAWSTQGQVRRGAVLRFAGHWGQPLRPWPWATPPSARPARAATLCLPACRRPWRRGSSQLPDWRRPSRRSRRPSRGAGGSQAPWGAARHLEQ